MLKYLRDGYQIYEKEIGDTDGGIRYMLDALSNDNFKKIIIVKGYKKPLYDDKGIIIIGLYNFLMDSKIIERI